MDIGGYSNLQTTSGAFSQTSGGTLNTQNNIGSYNRTQFSVIPEIELKLGYNITPGSAGLSATTSSAGPTSPASATMVKSARSTCAADSDTAHLQRHDREHAGGPANPQLDLLGPGPQFRVRVQVLTQTANPIAYIRLALA